MTTTLPHRIDDLFPAKSDWRIRVRVMAVWEATNTNDNNQLISLDMILIDKQWSTIHAFIPRSDVKKFTNLINEGSICFVKDFKVVNASPAYKPVTNCYKIQFYYKTVLKVEEDDADDFPRYHFAFADYNLIKSRLGDVEYLTDVIGRLTLVKPEDQIATRGRKVPKREIVIQLSSDISVRVTLWGNKATLIDFTPYEAGLESDIIIVITGTTIKLFNGQYSLSSTSATKVFVDPDIEAATSLKQRLHGTPTLPLTLEFDNYNKLSYEDQMFHNRLTVKQILKRTHASNSQAFDATVRATIKSIDTTSGWFYISCNKCFKKLAEDGEEYYCKNCEVIIKWPQLRFKVQATVSDDTADTKFILFNREIEKITQTTASHLRDKYSGAPTDFPLEITTITGQSYIFRLKVDDPRLTQRWGDYSIMRLFDIDTKLEASRGHQTNHDTEARSCLPDINAEEDIPTNEGMPDAATIGKEGIKAHKRKLKEIVAPSSPHE